MTAERTYAAAVRHSTETRRRLDQRTQLLAALAPTEANVERYSGIMRAAIERGDLRAAVHALLGDILAGGS